MRGDEIFNQLNESSSRWGANNQPTIYLITAILEQLPIDWIAGSNDRFQFYVSRELTSLEHWSIDRLTPDEVNRDGRQFDLWWD